MRQDHAERTAGGLHVTDAIDSACMALEAHSMAIIPLTRLFYQASRRRKKAEEV